MCDPAATMDHFYTNINKNNCKCTWYNQPHYAFSSMVYNTVASGAAVALLSLLLTNAVNRKQKLNQH